MQIEQELAPAQRHIIKRPRLTKLLDEAEARIILLVAPAGYGKTTLAREWLARRGRQALWCGMQSDSVDPVALARALAQTLSAIAPAAIRDVHDYVAASAAPDEQPGILADVLVQNIGHWPAKAWLVLDDYQACSSSAASEALIAKLVEQSRPQLLITSRERPRWIAARHILYGEVFEVGQRSLSMTSEEAITVLRRGRNASRDIAALADGWPAVLGLAALLPTTIDPLMDVPAIHDLFAQELFSSVAPKLRPYVALLAIPNSIDVDVMPLIGVTARRAIEEATRVGLLLPRERESWEIHPLVRTFLERKLEEYVPAPQLVSELVHHLVEAGKWDDAFRAIERYRLRSEIRSLLVAGTPELLAGGRLATLERWVRWARENEEETPEVSLTQAELFLRRGNWALAEEIAATSAQLLVDSPLIGRAYVAAGTAAHLRDNPRGARQHFNRALDVDDSLTTKRGALWGSFLVALYDGQSDYRQALATFEELPEATPVHVVRVAQARILVAARIGNISEAAVSALPALALLDDVFDPLVRTGFLNNLSNALVLAALYDEAQRIASRELHEAERAHLVFVRPNSLLNLAAGKLGCGDYAAASALIDRAVTDDVTGDSHLLANCAAVKARIHLARGHPADALKVLSPFLESPLRSDMAGEVVATAALAAACDGHPESAKALVNEAARRMVLVDARVLARAAETIIDLSTGSERAASKSLSAFVSVVQETGSYDSAICALRAEQRLLHRVAATFAGKQMIETVAVRSHDGPLAAAIGLEVQVEHRSPRVLSPREKEVLLLVAQGFRNIDIGRRLFISPKTVKTHLQHIYEKLEVRSRTEAAIKAKELGLLR